MSKNIIVTETYSKKKWLKLRLAAHTELDSVREYIECNSEPSEDGVLFLKRTVELLKKLNCKLEDI